MQIKIFTLPFNSRLGVFDDEKFNDFVKDKELVAVNDYFFHREETLYLTLVVKYKQSSFVEETVFHEKTPEKNNEDWRKLLDDDLMPLFNTLRSWRNEKSKKDGVPPYIILNNKQLAKICRDRPPSNYDLMKVEGIGKAKAEKYGIDILKIVSHIEIVKKNNEHPAQ